MRKRRLLWRAAIAGAAAALGLTAVFLLFKDAWLRKLLEAGIQSACGAETRIDHVEARLSKREWRIDGLTMAEAQAPKPRVVLEAPRVWCELGGVDFERRTIVLKRMRIELAELRAPWNAAKSTGEETDARDASPAEAASKGRWTLERVDRLELALGRMTWGGAADGSGAGYEKDFGGREVVLLDVTSVDKVTGRLLTLLLQDGIVLQGKR